MEPARQRMELIAAAADPVCERRERKAEGAEAGSHPQGKPVGEQAMSCDRILDAAGSPTALVLVRS